jgi:hypothetical protein
MFDAFEDPEQFSLGRAEFEDDAGAEWIVMDDNDVVIGIGQTPFGALLDVEYFVWPPGLGGRTLESWLTAYVKSGTPTYDLAIYKMLGVPMPYGYIHTQFVKWIQGLQA